MKSKYVCPLNDLWVIDYEWYGSTNVLTRHYPNPRPPWFRPVPHRDPCVLSIFLTKWDLWTWYRRRTYRTSVTYKISRSLLLSSTCFGRFLGRKDCTAWWGTAIQSNWYITVTTAYPVDHTTRIYPGRTRPFLITFTLLRDRIKAFNEARASS